MTTCPRACGHHNQIALNLNLISARKNLALTRRIFHAAPKSIRGKALAYLSFNAAQAGSREFDIPYNRQQLADYLGVDRSALSAELSRMQRDGLITTQRSHFVLHRAF
jgi:CRP-like cAMP-binding protein